MLIENAFCLVQNLGFWLRDFCVSSKSCFLGNGFWFFVKILFFVSDFDGFYGFGLDVGGLDFPAGLLGFGYGFYSVATRIPPGLC